MASLPVRVPHRLLLCWKHDGRPVIDPKYAAIPQEDIELEIYRAAWVMDRKHLKLKGKIELFTFKLAM